MFSSPLFAPQPVERFPGPVERFPGLVPPLEDPPKQKHKNWRILENLSKPTELIPGGPQFAGFQLWEGYPNLAQR